MKSVDLSLFGESRRDGSLLIHFAIENVGHVPGETQTDPSRPWTRAEEGGGITSGNDKRGK